jgi:hypothetical protein
VVDAEVIREEIIVVGAVIGVVEAGVEAGEGEGAVVGEGDGWEVKTGRYDYSVTLYSALTEVENTITRGGMGDAGVRETVMDHGM